MYTIYYEMGEDNQPFTKHYKHLKNALRFAHKQSQNPDTGWLDISNQGPDQSWYHTNVNGPDFIWYNGLSFQLPDLPVWMRPDFEETV